MEERISRSARRVAVALAATLALVSNATAGDRAGELRFGGAEVTLDAVPDAAIAGGVEVWQAWASRNGYRLELSDDADVLLVVPQKTRNTRRQTSTITRASAAWDSLFGPGEAPERTVVVLQLRDGDDYRAALDELARVNPWLSGWARSAAGSLGGFALEEPLVACWVEDTPGREEWNPDNELANKLAQLWLLRDFGRQPHWLATGLAWAVEQDATGSIYCFPYRDEFVSVADHGGWSAPLRKEFKRRRKEPLRMDELAAWRRGSWDADAAAKAWGLVQVLAVDRPGVLAPILEELAAIRARDGIVTHSDGSWEIVTDYEVPTDQQAQVFARHAGEDVLADVSNVFRTGVDKKKRK